MNAMANVPAPFNVLQSIATGIMGASAVQKILSTSPEIVIDGLVVPKSNISGLLLGNALCIGVLEKDNANWSTFNAILTLAKAWALSLNKTDSSSAI